MTRRRRGATDLSGVLVLDKPAGMTSHDVVAAVRRATGEGRVGHAGTLDPAATGVLVVLVGAATRLTPWLTSASKSYSARIAFGAATDTDDAEGTVMRTAVVPEALADPANARAHVASLIGQHQQVPPAYCAIKRGGIVAHRAARSGAPLDLEVRNIEVADAQLDAIDTQGGLVWEVMVTVSKGTYIRALARDLGDSLGTAAHLAGLRRLSSGTLTLAEAHPLSAITDTPVEISELFVDPVPALGVPVRQLTPDEVAEVASGSSIVRREGDAAAHPADTVAVADSERLWAIYRVSSDGASLVPVAVFAGGVAR